MLGKWWSQTKTHKISVPIITNPTANTHPINNRRKSVVVMLPWSWKIKIVRILKRDLTSCNRKNKKLSHSSNNSLMVCCFNKKYSSTTPSPLLTINSKPKITKRNSIETEPFLINPEINMDPNNSQSIQDLTKKLLKYLNLPDQNQSIPDFKIMLDFITKTWQWKVSTSFLKSKNKK